MCDWTEFDISKISEADFPVRCDRCDHLLIGPAESGRCPKCGLVFVRRQRLWKTYGPDAFATPPILPGEDDVPPGERTFLFVFFSTLVLTLSLPVVVLAWFALFGTIDLCFCLLSWLVVATSLEWILLRRRQERGAEAKADGDEGPD